MVTDAKDIISTLKGLDRLLIIARYNHLFLYDRKFWTTHIKAYRLMFKYKIKNRNTGLKSLSFFIWIKLIPLIIILWYTISFTLLIGLNLEGADRNMLFLVNFPHTLLIFWLYHKLSNKMIRNYHKKIEWNINVLKNIT